MRFEALLLLLSILVPHKIAFQISPTWNMKGLEKSFYPSQHFRSSTLQQASKDLDDELVRAEVEKAILTPKGNYSPIMVRLAWHSSGTYDKDDQSSRNGGSDGATMRFEPESTDPANAGLTIPQEVLKPIKHLFPTLSYGEQLHYIFDAFDYMYKGHLQCNNTNTLFYNLARCSGLVDFGRCPGYKDHWRP